MITGIYANVIIDISHESVDRTFQYRIPETLRGKISAGMCVEIPFGSGNRKRSGYVIEITDKPEYIPEKIKEIIGISGKGVLALTSQIRLAAWMRQRYGSTMIAALRTVLPAKQKMKTLQKRTVVLSIPIEQAEEQLKIFRQKKQTARERLFAGLCEKKELSYEYIVKELSVPPAVIRAMEEKGLVRVEAEALYRNPVRPEEEEKKKIILSPQQQRIVKEVMADYRSGKPDTYLIHGITGSGKTAVYIELIKEMVSLGKQAIVLIPEIALTYQTVQRFTACFGSRVSVLHSRLSQGEKYDQCQRAQRGEIDVMIGPRSALFTPFRNLGLIVIDEEHEGGYKSETMPKYHAREAAGELASYYGASVVLGSATPSLESYYASETGVVKRFELKERLTGGTLPKVYVEDLREELACGNRSVFSRRLQMLLRQRLDAGEQSMLFLNRRGYAGFVSCRACGHVMKCPHCDVSLSEHKGGKLICHYCGYEQPMVSRCPKCASKYILGFRAGTQQIEELLHRQFPDARVLRMDADTTRKKDSYQKILSAFAGGGADILVGTQMIVKGHDFPRVTLVGILAADLSLHAGDYRAGERTFQLLTQAAGRAGRGTLAGEVVIQTYDPEHHSIRHAANQDYIGFYQEEIAYRALMDYPPISHMLAVLVQAKEEEMGKGLAEELAKRVSAADETLLVIGPAPASIGKIGDLYRNVFYIKSGNMEKLVRAKDVMEAALEMEKAVEVSVQFDVDPMSSY